jgi:3-phosphoshikimate 1-carboxyvinyltransferase
MGADIQYLERHGFTPLSIKKGIQQWKDVRISAAISSQYASAFLLIAPLFSGTKNIVVTESSHSQAYLEMTVDILKRMGIEISSTQITSEIHYTIQGEYQDLGAHVHSSTLSFWDYRRTQSSNSGD